MFLFCRHFVGSLDFKGMEVDEALRIYQTCFRLPVSVYKIISICHSVLFHIGSSSSVTPRYLLSVKNAGNIP